MRFPVALAASLMLIGSVAAQNEFNIKPSPTDATSRGSLGGSSQGDILNAVYKTDFQYVGNSTSTSTMFNGQVVTNVTGFVVVIQDQDGSTIENFDLTIVPEDSSNPGTPDPVSGNELVRTTPFATPAATGTAAWIFTITLATPYENPNLINNTWFYGAGVPANQAWSNDGLSIHMASYYGLGGTFPATHDNPNLNAPDDSWTIDRLNNIAMQASSPRSFEVRVLTTGSVFRVGQDVVAGAQTGTNPEFGMGGVYPDNKATRTMPAYAARNGVGDGIVFRVRESALPGAAAFTFLSTGFSPLPGFNVPGIQGGIAIDFTTPAFLKLPGASGVLALNSASGQTEAVIAPAYLGQGKLMNIQATTLTFMSLIADLQQGILTLTNGQAVHFN